MSPNFLSFKEEVKSLIIKTISFSSRREENLSFKDYN